MQFRFYFKWQNDIVSPRCYSIHEFIEYSLLLTLETFRSLLNSVFLDPFGPKECLNNNSSTWQKIFKTLFNANIWHRHLHHCVENWTLPKCLCHELLIVHRISLNESLTVLANPPRVHLSQIFRDCPRTLVGFIQACELAPARLYILGYLCRGVHKLGFPQHKSRIPVRSIAAATIVIWLYSQKAAANCMQTILYYCIISYVGVLPDLLKRMRAEEVPTETHSMHKTSERTKRQWQQQQSRKLSVSQQQCSRCIDGLTSGMNGLFWDRRSLCSTLAYSCPHCSARITHTCPQTCPASHQCQFLCALKECSKRGQQGARALRFEELGNF